jgi:hypothetical protein
MSVQALIRSARVRQRGDVAASDDSPDRTIHRGIGPAENDPGQASTQQPSTRQQPTTDALARIMACIPAEIVLVYVATIAAITTDATRARTGQWVAFWAYLAATPVTLLFGVAAAGATSADKLALLKPGRWPWVEMIAATACFAIWGFTLPGTPFADFGWYRPAVATVVLLAGSLVIGLLAPIFGLDQSDSA